MKRGQPLSRRSPLRQGSSTLKRAPLKRAPAPRPRQSFDEIAWKTPHDGRCRACGATGAMQRHHVVYRQALARAGKPQWDLRDAMDLGWPWICDCHELHHNASKRIPMSKLSAENLAFAEEALGQHAMDYLSRRYGR